MDEEGLHPGWWTLILVAVLAVAVWLTYALFTGTLKSTVPVTLTSDRAGLVMETNAKVKLRGVQVGRVSGIGVTGQENPPVALRLEIDPDKLQFIPSNVERRSARPRSSAPSSSIWYSPTTPPAASRRARYCSPGT